jgi:hypothetical protein
MLTVFHRTTKDAAAKILRDGFRDTTSRYLTDREWSGVWVSDRPLDNSEGASGEALLQIDIAEELLTAFEWVEEGKRFREWLVPAAVLNDAGTVRLVRRLTHQLIDHHKGTTRQHSVPLRVAKI